jgi:hypothetical protein
LEPSWDVVQQALGDAFEEILLNPTQNPVVSLIDLDQTARDLIELSDE